MGKINGCLKCIFIFFNVLFAIIGCLMIFGAIKSTGVSSQVSAVGGPSMAWGWLFAIGILAISILGIYAACSEKALILKIFAGFMGVGMVIMLIFGIVCVVYRNKVRDALQNASSDIATAFMQDPGLRETLSSMQDSVHCCGVTSVHDWGNEIPQSCACRSAEYNVFGSHVSCVAKPQGAQGPSQIYSQPCSDIIFMSIDIVFKISMGICFGFAVTALLGLLVSLLMIHQIKRHDSSGGSSMAMKGY